MRAIGIVAAAVLLVISAALGILISAGDTSLVNLNSVANALATVTASPTVQVGVSFSVSGVPQLDALSGTVEASSQEPVVAIDHAGSKVALALFLFYDQKLVATIYSIATKAYVNVDLAPLAPIAHGAAARHELSVLESRLGGRWWELPRGTAPSVLGPGRGSRSEAALVRAEEGAVVRSSTVTSAKAPGQLLRIEVRTPLSAVIDEALPFVPALVPRLGQRLPRSIPSVPSLGQVTLDFYLDRSATLREVTARAAIGGAVVAAGVVVAHRDVDITTPPSPRRLSRAEADGLLQLLRALESAAPAFTAESPAGEFVTSGSISGARNPALP